VSMDPHDLTEQLLAEIGPEAFQAEVERQRQQAREADAKRPYIERVESLLGPEFGGGWR
jgi:hypothetical protein